MINGSLTLCVFRSLINFIKLVFHGKKWAVYCRLRYIVLCDLLFIFHRVGTFHGKNWAESRHVTGRRTSGDLTCRCELCSGVICQDMWGSSWRVLTTRLAGTSSFGIDRTAVIKLGKPREVRANISLKELRRKSALCSAKTWSRYLLFWLWKTVHMYLLETNNPHMAQVVFTYLGSTRITPTFLVDRSLT